MKSLETTIRHAPIDAALENLDRLTHAIHSVFSQRPLGRQLLRLCDQHRDALGALTQQGTVDYTAIALMGATGQGKTWLMQQIVHDPAVRKGLPSGDSQHEATRQIVWVGPRAPAASDSRHERYLYCAQTAMLDLGGPYLLVDTPGATDVDVWTAELAQQAIQTASVLVLVIRREQLRSQVPGQLAAAADGAIIIPVVTAIRTSRDDPAVRSDIDACVTRIRAMAPRSEIEGAIEVPDFALAKESEERIGEEFAAHFAQRLRPHFTHGSIAQRRLLDRVDALQERFFLAIQDELRDHLPRLAAAIGHLEAEVERLPMEVATELVGSGAVLRGAIRARVRSEILLGTPMLCFPYRTLLGILNLTQGAWDQLLLAFSGSLPSLFGVAWSSLRNVREGEARDRAKETFRNRCRGMVDQRLRPYVQRFREEVCELREGTGKRNAVDGAAEMPGAQLRGIEEIESQALAIFQREILLAAPSPLAVLASGLCGTLLFWGLLAGPIVALYRSYFGASYGSLRLGAIGLDQFPQPPLGLLLTSLLLSLLPTMILAMIHLTWSQRRSQQERIAARIDRGIEEMIDLLWREHGLRLEFVDPLLEDARFLVQVGKGPL